MPIAAIYAFAGALAGALASLLVYHLTVVRPALAASHRVLTNHDAILGDGQGASVRLEELVTAQAAGRAANARLERRLEQLEALSGGDISQVGFVRYNALDDTGSNLSYALALLNRRGDGVVLSSIYSRTDTRTYGKAVSAFKSATNASEEEMQAIERARSAPADS
jgi:hypothetical protein